MTDKISSGKDRPIQRRTPRRDGWTNAKRRAFLNTLAATANVAQATRGVGLKPHAAYSLRRRDPAFAELWQTALQTAYARLEGEVLARALGTSTVDEEVDADRAVEEAAFAKPIDPEVALKVLARRGANPDRHAPNAPGPKYKKIDRDQLTKALERQLAALEKRLRASRGGAP
ncbi:MAG: hypothetical protein C0500_10790 [Sphingobium sp.]|nr:hypothetical protein [Sphingobium sp.]